LRALGHGLSLAVGMAEQNLFGVAGGVARTGLRPYVTMIHIEVLGDRNLRSKDTFITVDGIRVEME